MEHLVDFKKLILEKDYKKALELIENKHTPEAKYYQALLILYIKNEKEFDSSDVENFSETLKNYAAAEPEKGELYDEIVKEVKALNYHLRTVYFHGFEKSGYKKSEFKIFIDKVDPLIDLAVQAEQLITDEMVEVDDSLRLKKGEACVNVLEMISFKARRFNNSYNIYMIEKEKVKELTPLYIEYAAKARKLFKKSDMSLPRLRGHFDKNNKNECYIATAAYGDYDHPSVKVLRNFRDTRLLTCLPGELFVLTYYTLSPKVARAIGSNRAVSRQVEKILDRFVRRLERK
jgi:hypothetical protein